jgi:hypothetical protein
MSMGVIEVRFQRWARGEGQGDDSWGGVTAGPAGWTPQADDAIWRFATWLRPKLSL